MKKNYFLGSVFLSILLIMLAVFFLLPSNNLNKAVVEVSPYSSQFKLIPKLMLPVLAKSLGRDDPSYHIQDEDEYLRSNTSSFGIETKFSDKGVLFSRDGYQVRMSLADSDIVRPEKESVNRVEYKRDGITEWYVNSPFGVEQGFTLHQATKEKDIDDKVVIAIGLELDHRISAQQSKDGTIIQFVNESNGKEILTYSGLFAYDSSGKELPSEMKLLDSQIQLLVDDSGAQYPIVIDPFVEVQKVIPSDAFLQTPPFPWLFGGTVELDGNRSIVGAIGANGFEGQAYIFDRDQDTGFWSETQILQGSTATAFGDQFGNCVHLSGDLAIVGASHSFTPTPGEAFVFERDPMTNLWTEVAAISASIVDPADRFGRACSIDETTGIALVGANFAVSLEGRAYVFEQDMMGNWNEIQVLTPSGGIGMTFQFGDDVSLQGDTAAVGAFGGDRVYMYDIDPITNMFSEIQIVSGSDTMPGDNFGVAVDFDGDNMIIGASGFDVDVGKAYLFERDTMTNMWSEVDTIQTTMPAMGDLFGDGVSISGTFALATTGIDASGNGRVFVYEQDAMGNWNFFQELVASDGMPNDQFGIEVALDGDQLIVGAAGVDGEAGDFTGAAYFYGNDVTLDVNIIGAGSGTVTSMPTGIDCGSMINDCTEDYNNQTLVTLTAVADLGSVFAGWSDDCTGVMAGTTIVMVRDSICTAQFDIAMVTLDVTIEGNGEGGVLSTNTGIDCNSGGTMDCDETYLFNTMVTLTATPQPLSYFVGWSGDAACTTDPTNPVLDLTMDMNISCIATFELLPVLDVIIEGNGTCTVTSEPSGIDCPGDCAEIIDPAGTTVDLTVIPEEPSTIFTGWSGDCSGVDTDTSITVNVDSTCIATCVLAEFVLNPVFPALDDNINFISAENAVPGGNVAFIWAKNTGNFTIGGTVCSGTGIELNNPNLLAISPANDFGTATYIFFIPTFNDLQFQVELQAVDIETCRTSNVVPQIIRKDDSG